MIPAARSEGFAVTLLAAALAVACGPEPEPWPPAVTTDEPGARPLTPAESMETIVLPPGYGVELVASEPLVVDPILLDFDADGRMWVVEMPAFAADETMHDSREPICRVVVLEDDDDDGAMDRRTVFVDGLVLPRAIKTLADGVLVGEPPNLWWMRDVDGDLKVDERELVSDSFGRLDGNPEHNANSLIWGLDNWIYTSEHDWHLRYRDGELEVVPTLTRGQWGGSIDDAGRVFRNVNNGPLFVDLVLARYFMRNPNVVRTRGLYESLIGLEEAVAWPIRPTRGVNRGYRDQFFRPDGSSRILQSAATPVVYRGDRLPEELRGGVFVTDSTTNLVHWFVVEDDGSGRLTARDGFAQGEIFASTDERLRPVGAASAPDGTLYVIDMYRGVVQDVAYQTEYLQDYIRRNELALPVNMGRIWRIVHESTVRDRKPALSGESSEGLLQYLSHPNGWWRDTAHQLLVQRGDRSLVPALRTLAQSAPDWRTVLHALGVLDGLGGLDPAVLEPLLAHPAPEVRIWAVRWSEPWLAEAGHPLGDAVVGLIDDPSWEIRRQVAASLGELPSPRRLEALVEVLHRYGDDAIAVDAAVSGLHGGEGQALDALLGTDATPDAAEAVEMLAGAVARSGDPGAVASVLERATAPDASGWRRAALLRGLGAGLPDPGGRRRGGPSGRRRASSEPVALDSEPEGLTALVEVEGDDTAALAKQVVSGLTWPGKPATVVEVPPLTPEAQARFAAGRELYQNLCVACHQPHGRGGDDVAQSLVGSERLLGDVGVPIRIVLSGMEGDIGLMPPLGALTDEEIASVLTYVRREWGNTGAAVAPEDVREIRGLTAVRTRPWTVQDLPTPPPWARR